MTTLVYDDSHAVPAEVAALLGLVRFGALLHDRRRLRDQALATAAQAGFTDTITLSDRAGREAFAHTLAETAPDVRYVYVTSDVVGESPDLFGRFLTKLGYAEQDTVANVPPGAVAASFAPATLHRLLKAPGPSERRAFLADRKDAIDAIPGDGLRSLADPDVFVQFVSGSFYTRAFNAIRTSGRTLRKSSADVDKIRAEHDLWYLLPPAVQRFFVQPFDLQVTGSEASYAMERLAVPDLAVLWIHGEGALPEDAFDAVLDALFEWVEARPKKRVSPAEARNARDALYRDKVRQRVEKALASPVGARADALLRAGTDAGGLIDVLGRYERLLDQVTDTTSELAITHGDLCFSNVLFERRSRLVKLIDPRGARSEAELWAHPSYDVAKLSHSVLGGYDFVNHGLFEVSLDADNRLALRVDKPDTSAHEARFRRRLADAGFDERLVRLYEASLFLSMVPLHQDTPRKLVAFALTAISVLDGVERAPAARRSW